MTDRPTLDDDAPVPDQALGWYGLAAVEAERAVWIQAAEMADAMMEHYKDMCAPDGAMALEEFAAALRARAEGEG